MILIIDKIGQNERETLIIARDKNAELEHSLRAD